MTTAGHVQVAPDGVGKYVDAQAVTTVEDNATTAYRQTVTLGDPATYGSLAAIDVNGALYVRADELTGLMHEQLRMSKLIALALISIGGLDLSIDADV